MRHTKISPLLIVGGLLLVLMIVVWVPAASAQCGSQASSCKNCHEVQAQDPVNNDGTGWHESHAFGDFCYICHAGNQAATDKDAAHEGMEAPMADIKASCQSCHPGDLEERAAVYAKVLGVETGGNAPDQALATLAATPIISEATEAAPVSSGAAGNAVPTETASACPVTDTQLAVNDPNLVDFATHYNRVVLGETPVNWGNVALVGLIGAVVLGGGGFVVINETRLSRGAGKTERVEGEYPPDVIDMLPALTNLKSQSRNSLRRILNQPEKTDQVLGLIDAVVSDDEEQTP